jgi:Cys-tRNA(Pro)/Cys-tRNA(Cys) deacylase
MARRSTPAIALLEARRVPFTVHTYPHREGAAYGPEAAEALGIDPARVFKTLVTEVDGALTVGVLPVVAQLDLKALAAYCSGGRRGLEVELAPSDLVELTGARVAPIAAGGARIG